jgi:hypothetical protein
MAVESAHYDMFGNIVAVIDGTTYSIPDEMGNRFRQMVKEWEDLGNTIAPYVAPPAPIVIYKPIIEAIAVFNINGDDIETVDLSTKFSGAAKVDVGKYVLMFSEPRADSNYMPLAYSNDNTDAKCSIKSDEMFDSYFFVTCVDSQNTPIDITKLSVEIKSLVAA